MQKFPFLTTHRLTVTIPARMAIVGLIRATRKIAGSGYVVFGVTLATRFAVLFRLLPEQAWVKFYPLNEPSHIAWALVSGFGYSAPWPNTPVAATAQQPPFYPLLLSALFKLAGTYSLASLWIAVSLNALFSALTAVVILRLGRRDFSEGVAIVAAWAWALWLYEAAVAVRLWESSLTALITTLTLWWLPFLGKSKSWKYWIAFGVMGGLAAQNNTTMLAMFPCFYVILWSRLETTEARKRLLTSFAIMLLTLVPWTVRNYVAFDRLLPLRDNFGLELWIGNREGVDQAHQYPSAFPLIDPTEYNQLGELRFMELKRQEAFHFIFSHPSQFAWYSGRRILDFWIKPDHSGWLVVSLLSWVGLVLAMVRSLGTALPYAAVIALFPLVYYITHTFSTYRHPIEPAMLLLAAYALRNGLRVLPSRSRHGQDLGGDGPEPNQ